MPPNKAPPKNPAPADIKFPLPGIKLLAMFPNEPKEAGNN
jgi:hypothetical protein